MTTATFQVDLTANTTNLILILLHVAQFIIFWISPLKAWCSVFTHTYTPQTGSWWALPLLRPRLPLPRCWWRNCPSGALQTLLLLIQDSELLQITSYSPVMQLFTTHQLSTSLSPVIQLFTSCSQVTHQVFTSYPSVTHQLFTSYLPVIDQLLSNDPLVT